MKILRMCMILIYIYIYIICFNSYIAMVIGCYQNISFLWTNRNGGWDSVLQEFFF